MLDEQRDKVLFFGRRTIFGRSHLKFLQLFFSKVSFPKVSVLYSPSFMKEIIVPHVLNLFDHSQPLVYSSDGNKEQEEMNSQLIHFLSI